MKGNNKRNIVGFVLLLFTNLVFGFTYAQVSTSVAKQYSEALNLLQDGKNEQAKKILLQVVRSEPNYMEATLSLAGVYSEIKRYDSSVLWYEAARRIHADNFNPYNLPYSIALAGVGKFQEALAAVDQFLQLPNMSDAAVKSGDYRRRCYQFAIDYQQKNPHTDFTFTPINLGDNINTSRSEYYPSLTYNDSILVYTQRGNGYREDFMQSTLLKTGKYSEAKRLKGPINEEPSKGALDISQDGEWLLFAGNFPGKGVGDFDLYIAYYGANGWSDPFNLGPAVNTEFWESAPSLSADRVALYFSSNRPDGYGGMDLYVSYLQDNGRFGPAENLGPTINTIGDETAPCIHADNQTLYFTSNGHPGYGGTDLFVCRKDTSGEWKRPENLGYPINTIDNEGSMFVSAKGAVAYYASDREDSRGGLDLYKFDLRKDLQPIQTIFVKGQIVDEESHLGIDAIVEVSENSKAVLVTRTTTDPDGNFMLSLPSNHNYTVTYNSKGHLFQTDIYNLQKHPIQNVKRTIALGKIKIDASLTLKNIQFAFNSAALEDVSQIELRKVLELMNDNPTLKIMINGHTDNVGSEAANQQLSNSRAKAVANYLFIKGIKADRLKWQGFGKNKPIASNDTEEGRATNRRTEIVVTEI